MSGEPATELSLRTSRETHYLVFAPGTAPLGQETDTPITDAFAAFADGNCHSLDLILRVSDRQQIDADPTLPYWLRVRFYPDRATVRQTGQVEMTSSGTAYRLEADGCETDAQYHCTVAVQIIDQLVGTRIGELTLTHGG